MSPVVRAVVAALLLITTGCATTPSVSIDYSVRMAEAEARAMRAESALESLTAQGADPDAVATVLEGAEIVSAQRDVIAAQERRIAELEAARPTAPPAATYTDRVGGDLVQNRSWTAGMLIPSDPSYIESGRTPFGVSGRADYCWDSEGPSMVVFTAGGPHESTAVKNRPTLVKLGDVIVPLPLAPAGRACTARPGMDNTETIFYVFSASFRAATGEWVYEPACRVERGGVRAHSPDSDINLRNDCDGSSVRRLQMTQWLYERWVTPSISR